MAYLNTGARKTTILTGRQRRLWISALIIEELTLINWRDKSSSKGNFLEDFFVGRKFLHATPRTITQGDSSLYIGLTGARHPANCSEPFAKGLGYKTTPVDDFLVFNMAFGKTVPDISANAIANLGYADVRFSEPVYPR
jgi:2-methylfumaryl-CoA hydratase